MSKTKVNEVAEKDAKYVVVDDGEFMLFATKVEAMQAANKAVEGWREYGYDGWPYEVEDIIVAEIIARPKLMNPEAHYSVHEYEMKEVK